MAKLRRSSKGKLIGGVCSGLEKYNGIPIAVSRVAFVLAMIPLAVVIPPIIYGVLCIFVPDDDRQSMLGSQPDPAKASADLEEELKKLQDLKDKNLISEEDYGSLRAKAMSLHVDDEKAVEEDSVSAELRRLQGMHENGIINSEELAKMRKRVLGID